MQRGTPEGAPEVGCPTDNRPQRLAWRQVPDIATIANFVPVEAPPLVPAAVTVTGVPTFSPDKVKVIVRTLEPFTRSMLVFAVETVTDAPVSSIALVIVAPVRVIVTLSHPLILMPQ
jgi:hypothetical protein